MHPSRLTGRAAVRGLLCAVAATLLLLTGCAGGGEGAGSDADASGLCLTPYDCAAGWACIDYRCTLPADEDLQHDSQPPHDAENDPDREATSDTGDSPGDDIDDTGDTVETPGEDIGDGDGPLDADENADEEFYSEESAPSDTGTDDPAETTTDPEIVGEQAEGGPELDETDGASDAGEASDTAEEAEAAPHLWTSGDLDFGAVSIGSYFSEFVTLRNDARDAALTIDALRFSPEGQTVFALAPDTPALPWRLSPGADFAVAVVFVPAAEASFQAALIVSHNDLLTDHGATTLVLTGRGVAPLLRADPPAILFPRATIGEETWADFSLTNTGLAAVFLRRLTMNDDAFTAPAFPDGGVLLPPDGVVDLRLHFTPAAAGQRSALLTAWCGDALTACLTVPLQGDAGARSDPACCGDACAVCSAGAHAAPRCDPTTDWDDYACGCSCSEGRDNCNDDCGDGCETTLGDINHCGACFDACPSAAHALPACVGGVCDVVCLDNWDACGSDPADGCATDLLTDPAHCGGCDKPCDMPDGAVEVRCEGGACAWTCDEGLPVTASGCGQPTLTVELDLYRPGDNGLSATWRSPGGVACASAAEAAACVWATYGTIEISGDQGGIADPNRARIRGATVAGSAVYTVKAAPAAGFSGCEVDAVRIWVDDVLVRQITANQDCSGGIYLCMPIADAAWDTAAFRWKSSLSQCQ